MSVIRKPSPTLWTRRSLLARLGWALVSVTGLVTLFGSIRLLFPRVRYRPDTTVILGKPESFTIGEVSVRFVSEHRIVLVREKTGFYALRAVCTHLGCIPRYREQDEKYKCFCHGSGFTKEGTNIEGPAPRPLERFQIDLNDAGEIVVDTEVRFRPERIQLDQPPAYLNFPVESLG